MESPELKPTPGDDAALDAWLRRAAALPPLADAGFSARVLATLPPPANHRARQRRWVCIAGALAGLAVAAAPVLSRENKFPSIPLSGDALLSALALFADPALGLALLVTAASLLYVFWRGVRQVVHL